MCKSYMWLGMFCPTGKLMNSLLNGINDRSSVIQKSFAFAIGHLVRVWKHTWMHISIQPKATIELQNSCFPHQAARDSSVEKLLQKLNTWYLEKEGMRTLME